MRTKLLDRAQKTKHILALLAVIAVATVVIWYFFIYSRPLIGRQTTEAAEFSVYVPKSLPKGFRLKDEQTMASSKVVSYVLASEDDSRQVAVTVQPLPSNFDMTKLIGSGSINSTSTTKGILYDLSVAGSSKYLLNTGDSLVFFTSAESIDVATINSMVNDLVRQD